VCAGVDHIQDATGLLVNPDLHAGTLHLERKDGTAIGRVRVFGTTGRLIHEGTIAGPVGTLPIGGLAAGTYLLSTGEAGDQVAHRFVVSRP